MGRGSWGDSFVLGEIVKIFKMEEHGPLGKTDDTGVAEVTFGKNPNSQKKRDSVCFTRSDAFIP